MSELPADLPDVQMVQCDVTGRTVPLDETIELHGYRVCAEGKQILLDRLKAGESLPGELERSSFWCRFVAIFVDVLIQVLIAIILVVPIFHVAPLSRGADARLLTVTLLRMILCLAVFCYYGFMHAKYGQTWGKMAMKIRVVQQDGSAITTAQAWNRALLYYGPTVLLAVLAYLTAMFGEIPWMPFSISNVTTLVWIYFIAEIITALVDRQQQRAIHDYAAGTRVIRIP